MRENVIKFSKSDCVINVVQMASTKLSPNRLRLLLCLRDPAFKFWWFHAAWWWTISWSTLRIFPRNFTRFQFAQPHLTPSWFRWPYYTESRCPGCGASNELLNVKIGHNLVAGHRWFGTWSQLKSSPRNFNMVKTAPSIAQAWRWVKTPGQAATDPPWYHWGGKLMGTINRCMAAEISTLANR